MTPEQTPEQENMPKGMTKKQIGRLIELMPGFKNSEYVARSVEIAEEKRLRAEQSGDGTVEKPISRTDDIRRMGAFLLFLENKWSTQEGREKLIRSSTTNLTVSPDNIPESYWQRQEQIARDEGRGDIEIGQNEKNRLTKELQDAQLASMKSWSDYLFEPSNPYPDWFKFYAWDGMSRLGTFDKKEGQFNKRSKSTVAPFPQISPDVLSKIYDVIDKHVNDRPIDDPQILELVKLGSFNKLYSHFLLETKSVVSTPERPGDVKGQWIQYKPEDWQKLTEASQGTPWCIAGESMTKSYLGEPEEFNEAGFYLFHLEDPRTCSLSPTACASIRLDSSGRVVEVSGLKSGQAIEDSLIPQVEEKVKSLSGGENFLEAFADKKMLIAMDRKFQAGEEFTADELIFLYELDRPIRKLGNHGGRDPRIEEFRQSGEMIERFKILKDHSDQAATKFLATLDSRVIVQNLVELKDAGANIDVNELVPKLKRYPHVIAQNLVALQQAGANIDVNQLVSRLDSRDILDHLDKLIEAKADGNQIVSKLKRYPRIMAQNLDRLLKAGATNIDANQLVSQLRPVDILYNLVTFQRAGAEIDVNRLMYKIKDSYDILHNLVVLQQAGATKGQILSRLEAVTIVQNLTKLQKAGITMDQILSHLEPYEIAEGIDKLQQAGANIDVDELVSQLELDEIAESIDNLQQAGANIDVNELVSGLRPIDKARNILVLQRAGANIDVNELVSQLNSRDITENLSKLKLAGASREIIDAVLAIFDDDIDEDILL